jgi:hypothetical protein
MIDSFYKEPLFGEPLSGEAKNSLEGDVMNIYFQTKNFNSLEPIHLI